ncbi:HDOD domain-containing protein [Fundidesulfovibrio butyratiphilus]
MAQYERALAQPDLPLFARQPVFDAKLAVYGYELLYRRALFSSRADFADSDAATLTVISGAFLLQEGDLSSTQKVLVNFSRRTILDKAPYALPPRRTVVQVNEGERLDCELLDALSGLKRDGFLVAADGVEGRPGAASLLALADLGIVDMRGKSAERLAALQKTMVRAGVRPMAKRVETEASFQLAHSQAFELFQGYFFKRPAMVTGRKLASGELARLKLLRLTQSEEPDAEALRQVIRSDVSLSYRLLAYLSSPLHGQRPGFLSIDRAIPVLGWKQLRNWLRVVALTDETPTGKASELAFLSFQRAGFLKALGEARQLSPDQTETLYTLGLFSLLDVLLSAPMPVLLAVLPLEANVARTLCGEDSPLTVWLDLCRSYEQGDWPRLEQGLRALEISTETTAACYLRAMDTARQVLLA